MTGYIGVPTNYISAMTVAALEDMSYETLWDSSDPADTGGMLPDPINDLFIA